MQSTAGVDPEFKRKGGTAWVWGYLLFVHRVCNKWGGGGGIWGILPHKNFIFPEGESGVIWKYIIFNNTRTLLVEATLAALWLASLTMSIVNTALIASQSCFSCIILL